MDSSLPSSGGRPSPTQNQTDWRSQLPPVAGEAGWANSLPPSPSLEEATVLRTGCQASSSSYSR